MLSEALRLMTVAEYLAFEAASEIKNEYIDGRLYPMSGAKYFHNVISRNLLIWFQTQLEGSGCEALGSDMRGRVSPQRYVYPDVSVVCGEPYTDANVLDLLQPILLVEVTSPASASYDRIDKLSYYTALDSLQAYLIVEKQRPFVELHSRALTGWRQQIFSAMDAEVPLRALACSLPLREIYRNLPFARQ